MGVLGSSDGAVSGTFTCVTHCYFSRWHTRVERLCNMHPGDLGWTLKCTFGIKIAIFTDARVLGSVPNSQSLSSLFMMDFRASCIQHVELSTSNVVTTSRTGYRAAKRLLKTPKPQNMLF